MIPETVMIGIFYELYCFFEDGLLAAKIIAKDLTLIASLREDWLNKNPGSSFTTVCRVTREHI